MLAKRIMGNAMRHSNRIKSQTPSTAVEPNALKEVAKSSAPPTIVFAWSQNVQFDTKKETTGFWGLGDSLRGILSIYQFCKKNRYEFIIDTHLHPFSQFFENNTSPYQCNKDESPVTFAGDDGGMYKSLNLSVKPGGVYHIFCNSYPLEPLLSDEKRLIRNLLTIKPEFKLDLPKDPYSVFHIRVGDPLINGIINEKDLVHYTQIVGKKCKMGDVICSDSNQLKHHLATMIPGIRVYMNDNRCGHVGYDTDPVLLRNTLDDLQIVLGAARVYTYSNYSWISGFVEWGCKCFDIPLVNIK